jgi:ATP-binding cassette subfamily F protein 3
MLLDEPTNYLDLESRIWLRNYLNQTNKALMIVSHDQDFLDETVNEVYELFNGKLNRYSGNYSSYVKQREQELEQLEKEFKSQQKEIEKTEQFIERFRYKATKARQVQSRIKQLDKIELVQVPAHLRKLNFSFPDPPHSGKEVVKVTNLSKSYGSLTLFDNFSFYLNRGDRLAVTGRNGVGKTTLLRLLGEQDYSYSGSIELGTNVKLGYFAQEVKPTFDINNTILEELEGSALTVDLPRLRTLLGSFLFSDDDVDKKVGVLSGGEMSRLALLKILLHPANLLILDEPTNHLDINAKQVLSEALKKYKGTVVFVSHDNHFIRSMANRILHLSDEGPTFYEGDFDYFSWKLEEQEAISTPQTASETVTRNNNQLAYKEANRLRNRIQSLKSDSKKLLEKIDKTQKAIEEVVTLMALEENYSDSDKIVSLVNKKEELDNKELSLEEKWFSIQKELEELENVLA